jgi:hypothetical protein
VSMGIDTAAAQLILLARNQIGFDPSRALIFGHQKNYIGPILKRDIQKHLRASKAALDLEYADGFFSAAGIPKLDVLDISDYEGATVIQDLNFEISDAMQKYSLVIDIGTLEHVFNIGQGLENIKRLCLPGGYVLMLSPANNWLGHGFYQFSPELFFRNFDDSQGWEVKAVYLVRKSLFRVAWYEVPDPKVKGRRGNLHSKGATYVGVIARKREKLEFSALPQQSDYEGAWDGSSISRLGALYLRLPKSLRTILDVTLMAALTRYRGRLTRRRFEWENGRLVLR